MKKFLFAVAIMMASTSAFAQSQHEPGSFTIQPRIGFSAADFNNTKDTKARVGLVVGPEFEYTLSNRFSIAAGINYSQQGAELDNTDIVFKNDYLTVPITANFYVLKGFALKAGIQPGMNLDYKLENDGKELDTVDDLVKAFDLAVPVGLSYEFPFGLVLDARYTLGLTKIFEEKKFQDKGFDLDSKNLTFQFTLGYKFTLF